MKKVLFSFLFVAFTAQAQASQVVAEVQLSPSARKATVHYAHWIKKYPVEFKQGKCNELPDSDLNCKRPNH